MWPMTNQELCFDCRAMQTWKKSSWRAQTSAKGVSLPHFVTYTRSLISDQWSKSLQNLEYQHNLIIRSLKHH